MLPLCSDIAPASIETSTACPAPRIAPAERRNGGKRAKDSRLIADQRKRQRHGVAAQRTLRRSDSADCRCQFIAGRQVSIRAAASQRRHVQHDGARIHRFNPIVRQTKLSQPPGRKTVDNDIREFQQLGCRGPPLGAVKRQRHRALAAIKDGEVRTAPPGVAARWFDTNRARPLFHQQHGGISACQMRCELDHRNTVEHLCHLCPACHASCKRAAMRPLSIKAASCQKTFVIDEPLDA